MSEPSDGCCGKPGCCGPGPSRREFLKFIGAGAAAAALPAEPPATAAAPAPPPLEELIPADKGLGAEWLASLTARGQPAVYRGADLRFIGMPVGGLCCGQLYLGGDGKLWHWDIFNRHARTGAEHYLKPMEPSSPLDQGFALRVKAGGKSEVRALDRTGFPDVSFRGEYPVGYVEYRDPALPVAVSLEAFSPFIPLNFDDSSLPATVMRFTVTNTGPQEVEAELAGWLENAVCLHSARPGTGLRRSSLVPPERWFFLDCRAEAPPDLPDFGTMGIGLLEAADGGQGTSSVPEGGKRPENIFADAGLASDPAAEKPFGQKLCGAVGRRFFLAPGRSAATTFLVAWHFPNLKIDKTQGSGRHYAARFKSAFEVADYVRGNFDRLASTTRLWHDTWYDSTLPRWLLDRSFLNTSILATSTCQRFADGRFYAWEGVGCCPGTCTHVWHYAHAPARLFPELERALREKVDYGLAMDAESGRIRFRGEHNNHWAADGQAGCILRTYREHQMSPDDGFLRRVWPQAKKALEFLIREDADGDGILEGAQHNTLDADWYGPVAWLSGLYLAALRAGEEMARETGDDEFAARCRAISQAGRRGIVERLWGGDYFINILDPKNPEAINSGTGCHIDQVMGQSWAFQAGLGRVFDEEHSRQALRAIWRYNFAPDVGPYRAAYKPGRWYATAGEAGLVMCTFPRPDWSYEKARGKGDRPTFAGYFNECMNGFEYQAAGHMIWEGMVQEGLAVARAVHDRYHPSKRNPWNEVECGDHYARSMASYGVFLAACGYEYHGPKGRLGMAPRLGADDFRAAFTAAEGWGTFSQKRDGRTLRAAARVKFGRLRLRTLGLAMPDKAQPKSVSVKAGGAAVQAKHALDGARLLVALDADAVIEAGRALEVAVEW